MTVQRIDALPFPEYLDLPGANSSRLKTLLTHSPRRMREEIHTATAAMSLGTLVHALQLTFDTWSKEIAVRPDEANKASNRGKALLICWLMQVLDDDFSSLAVDRNLPEGKRLSAEIAIYEEELQKRGITVCTEADLEKAKAIREAIMAHPICAVLFASGAGEVTMLADDPSTGVSCKARIDWLPAGHQAIVDLKTTQDASFSAFSRTCAQYEYPLQAALYRRVYRLVEGESAAFLHVAAQTVEPYEVAVYELDTEALQVGERRLDRALSIWKRCADADWWPGAGYDWDEREYRVESLSLPRWALY